MKTKPTLAIAQMLLVCFIAVIDIWRGCWPLHFKSDQLLQVTSIYVRMLERNLQDFIRMQKAAKCKFIPVNAFYLVASVCAFVCAKTKMANYATQVRDRVNQMYFLLLNIPSTVYVCRQTLPVLCLPRLNWSVPAVEPFIKWSPFKLL